MDINKIKKLSDAVGIGHLKDATEIAKEELKKYAEVSDFGSIGLIARINKNKNKTIMLEAHIDEVGFVVTHVFDDGFVKVSNIGGNDHRILPATPVIIHGKEDVPAVFASTPPHLSKGNSEVSSADEILLDTGLSISAKEIICSGDIITYDSLCAELSGNKITGKSLDDRAAVACLIEVAKRLASKELPVNVIICLSEQEELGTRGARTASYAIDCDEAIAIDVSFGDAPDVPAAKCGKLSCGAMIGISPILNKVVTDKITQIAKEKNIPCQFEVMGGTTGTDADVISISKEGVPCGLISIPLRNMHTPCEIVDLLDMDAVCDILENYILCGGAL